MPHRFRPVVFIIAGWLLVSMTGCGRSRPPDFTSAFAPATKPLPELPATLDQPVLALMPSRVVAIGRGPDASVFHHALAGGGAWERAEFPPGTSGPIEHVVSTREGVFLFPGRGSSPTRTTPIWLRTQEHLTTELLPPLPEGHTLVAATAGGGSLHAISSAGRLLALPLASNGPSAWKDWGAVPSPARSGAALAVQSDGQRARVFFFTEGAVVSFEPGRREWQSLGAPPGGGRPLQAVPVGVAHVCVVFAVDDSAPAARFRFFNPVTRAWTDALPWPAGAPPAAIAADGSRLLGARLAAAGRIEIDELTYTRRARGLHGADYAVITVFAAGLVTMGFVNSSRFRTAESYFRGGKKIPWFAAGLSVVATGQSATSFISIPARSFATNWQFSLVPLTNVFGALIMSRYFVRFFVRLNITSGYEYLQARFSPLVRTIGSLNYLAYETTRISLLILVPAVAVSAVTKLDIAAAIVMMGAIATLYTTLGGLEGVVWADVVQITVKIVAIIVAVVAIFAQLHGNPLEHLATAWHEGKFRAIDWSFDLTRDTIWALLLFWFTDGLKSYVANQTIIQRFVSTRDERAAQRSIKASAVVGTLIFWIFMLAGTGLYLFYRQHPERLDLTMDKPDAVFPWFIVFELPPGVAGFLITALIAAALSSLYGALNSTSTVMVTDFYRRFAGQPSDAGALKLGRALTVVMGLVATGLALLLSGLSSRFLVEQTLSVIGLFGGGLGGLFLVGMLTTRVGAGSALVGFFTSALVQYFVSRHTPLHWLTYMFTGMGSCFLAAYLAGFLWPERKDLNGLTVHTCAR